MNRKIWFMTGTFLIVSGLLFATIHINSPRNGDLRPWVRGEKRIIEWTHGGVTGPVRVVLRRNNSNVGVIKNDFPVDALNRLPWKVGEYIGGTAPVGKNYRIRIRIIGGSFKDSDSFDIISNLKESTNTGVIAAKPVMPKLPLNVYCMYIGYDNLLVGPGEYRFFLYFQSSEDLPQVNARLKFISASFNHQMSGTAYSVKANKKWYVMFTCAVPKKNELLTLEAELDPYNALNEYDGDNKCTKEFPNGMDL